MPQTRTRAKYVFSILLLCMALLANNACVSQEEGSEAQSDQSAGETTSETAADENTVADETGEKGSSSPAEEQLPEEVLALQYEYINRGDFEKAYSLFAEQSRQEVSLEQYRAFFEANAPYSLTDYSFSPAHAQGDSATVDVVFTANSPAGAEQLQRTQRFMRENGEWRVMMRPDQIAAFTATGNTVHSQEQAPPPKKRGENASEAEPKKQIGPQTVEAALGETADLRDRTLVVNGIERNYAPPNRVQTPEPGNEYILVTITLTNTGNQSFAYNPNNFKMQDSSGVQRTPQPIQQLPYRVNPGSLASGGTLEANMVFEAPQGDSGLSLVYEPFEQRTLGTITVAL